jgi:hypothetical protein
LKESLARILQQKFCRCTLPFPRVYCALRDLLLVLLRCCDQVVCSMYYIRKALLLRSWDCRVRFLYVYLRRLLNVWAKMEGTGLRWWHSLRRAFFSRVPLV